MIPKMRPHHPCFFAKDKAAFGRIHLPVASSCNISCAYCRRDHDCAHENRPGVTSYVISPEAALDSLAAALEDQPHICVAGIAGPGDAFSRPELTLETFELIQKHFPDLSLCVSTNGLNLAAHAAALHDLGVNFVTITINAIDARIGARLVKAVTLNGKTVHGEAGARLLIQRQMDAVEALLTLGFTVKINTVVIPGINDDHSLFIAKRFGAMGVNLMNLIPLIPVPGTEMEDVTPPTRRQMVNLRKAAGNYIPQMHHCKRCRSDALGCL